MHTRNSNMYQKKQYNREKLPKGISEKALTIHQDKLYAGYVAKLNEINEKLVTADLTTTNQTYSELRGLKDGETFATNGVYLHEHYFAVQSDLASRVSAGALADALTETYGSYEKFVALLSACGMASRGWVVLGWDTHISALKIYCGDAHNQGGVWGTIPLLVLDVYEHAYFMDYGADRKKYIDDFMSAVNWRVVEERFEKIKNLVI